jgi:hypothetical protein
MQFWGVWLLKYIRKKQGPKVRAMKKFRDITNTLFVAVCLFRDKTNPALQGGNVRGLKNAGM